MGFDRSNPVGADGDVSHPALLAGPVNDCSAFE
jgi:hypothetical protein